MTALADSPAARQDRRPTPDLAAADLARHGPRSGPSRGPVRDGPGPGEDRPVLAAAAPGLPRRRRGVVRLGRHRAEDRVRPGLPAAGHLVLAPPGHDHHPADRRRGVRGLRAARLAGDRSLDQHRTRRFAKWSAICSFALGMAGQVAYHLLVQAGESPGAVGHHHPRVLPAGPGPGHGDRAGPHAARGRRSSRPRTARRSRTSDSRAADALSGPAIRGPAQPESSGPDRRRAPAAGTGPSHCPARRPWRG